MSAPDAPADRTPDEIERDIERTREELGDTVAALAGKPGQVKEAAKETALSPKVLGAAGAVVVLLVVVAVVRRRRAD